MVADTDTGKEIQENIFYLEELLEAYREGTIMEEVGVIADRFRW